MMPKGFQNGTQIHAQTHQQSMQTLVQKKERGTIIQYSVLKGQSTLKYHYVH